MGLRGYSILTSEQEEKLRDEIEPLWNLKNVDGTYRYTGTEIAKAIGFGKTEVPDNPYTHLKPERIYNYRQKLGIEPRREYRGYPHRYKNKRDEVLKIDDVVSRIEAVPARALLPCPLASMSISLLLS